MGTDISRRSLDIRIGLARTLLSSHLELGYIVHIYDIFTNGCLIRDMMAFKCHG